MKLMEALRCHADVAYSKFKETGVYGHNLLKGETREHVLRDFLRDFLPNCYGLGTGQVFSADGQNSKQIDIVIYDTMYSLVMRLDDTQHLFPCESVFGNIEVKSKLNNEDLDEAVENIRSVKSLKRADSIALDITPIYRLSVGGGLEYDRKKRNPYLGIVFALDGMEAKKVRDRLLEYPVEDREILPDYIFNLKKKYMVSRWARDQSTTRIMCGVGGYHGFMFCYLNDSLLPIFYLVLTVVLNSTLLKQTDVAEKTLSDELLRLRGDFARWSN